VGEYWRYDPHPEPFYRTHLAGDRLIEGQYEPQEITRTERGALIGYSPALGLELHWEEGQLRFFNRETESYLLTDREREAAYQAALEASRTAQEERQTALEAYRVAEAQRQQERFARESAEAELARLRRMLSQGNDAPPQQEPD